MSAPLVIDLFCGLGGFTEGFLAEGYEAVGFDIEQHAYGEHRYPADLVLQDVRTIHGKQFKDAAIIVASSPCQEYSYMAMPWSRAKAIANALRGRGEFPDGYTGSRTIEELNDLFNQPRRIQREACEAAGRYIPMIQENVRGAQPWVGRARWAFGSFLLWGDVPALMPTTMRRQKFNPDGTAHPPGSWFAIADSKNRGAKIPGQDWNNFAKDGTVSPHWRMEGPETISGSTSSKSSARKAASARIAKIPFALASHIARVYRPASEAVA